MSDPTLWRHARRCVFERGEVGEHDCDCGLFAYRAALSTTPAPLRQSCASCGHDDVDHAASGDGSCVAPDCWCAALSTTPAPLDVEAIADVVATLPLYDERDRIVTMAGDMREPRTMADAAEAFRARTVAAIRAIAREYAKP